MMKQTESKSPWYHHYLLSITEHFYIYKIIILWNYTFMLQTGHHVKQENTDVVQENV